VSKEARMSKLIPIEKLDETALAGAMSSWTAYRLIREGLLPVVRIGRRVFLTEAGINEFIARGGAGQPALRRGAGSGEAA
jgi:hypothetical protein